MEIIKKHSLIYISYICFTLPVFAQSSEANIDQYEVEFNVDSFSYSEVMPVIETFAGVIPVGRIGKEASFSDEPDAGRNALTHNRANLKVAWENWFIQLATRYDYNIQFTPDAAQLFFLDRNERPVDKTNYLLEFSANHVRGNGIGLGYQWQYKGLMIAAVAHYWDVQHMEHGRIDGVFSVNEDGDSFEVTGDIQYNYFDDALLDRLNCEQTDPPKAGCHGGWETDGYGYNLDLELGYQINARWRLDAVIYDLFNEFKYDKVGKTVGRLDTKNEVFNPDGSFSIRPSFSGRYPDGKFNQHVSTQANLRVSAEYLIPIWAEMYAANDAYFPSLGIGYSWLNTRFELGYQYESQAILIRAKHDYFELSVASETVDFQQARAIGLNLAIRYAW